MKNFEDVNRAQRAMELLQTIARGISSLLFNWDEKGSPSERLQAYWDLRFFIADMFDKNPKSIKYQDYEDGHIRRLDFYKTVMITDKKPSDDQELTSTKEYLRGYITEATAQDGRAQQRLYIEYNPRTDFNETKGFAWDFLEIDLRDLSSTPIRNRGKVKYFDDSQPPEPQIISSSRGRLTRSEANLATFLSSEPLCR